MLQQVLAQPHWERKLTPRDFSALTPLIWEHVNPYGRFELDREETERRAADKPQFATRAFLYSVIRDGRVERATLISQDIRTEPEALAHLRQRFP